TEDIDEIGRLTDTIAAHIQLTLEEKQELLELLNPSERAEKLAVHMSSQVDIFNIDKKIRGRVKKQMEKSQREYYLNEQMKAIERKRRGRVRRQMEESRREYCRSEQVKAIQREIGDMDE